MAKMNLGKWFVRLLLTTALVIVISLVVGMAMGFVAPWVGAMFGGAILLAVQIGFLVWARQMHKGGEDVLDILITAASAMAVVAFVGSFVDLGGLLQYSFSLTGAIGTLLVTFGTVILASTFATKVPVGK